MEDLNLNSQLQVTNSPLAQSDPVNGFDFKSNTAAGAITASRIQNLSVGVLTAGTINTILGVGGANITINGETQQIIVNDGTFDRVLIGFGTF
jgi:hypothetical protein